MSPNSNYDSRETVGKARRSILIPKTLTPIKIFPAKFFVCNASPYRGFVDSSTDNKENIMFNIDLHEEASPDIFECIIAARSAREGLSANKVPGSLGRKPLRELSQVEINACSMQASTVVYKPVLTAAPKGEQKAEYEGLGKGSLLGL